MTDWHSDSRGSVIPLIRLGRVVDNSDPNGVGALKVRIDGIDKNDSDGDLVPALPLLPKFLNIVPEPGQGVFIFEYEHRLGLKTANKSKRYWIGPIVSQLQRLEDSDYKDAQSQETDGWTNPGPSVDTIPKAKGAYPNKTDISLMGRDNADLIFKPKEVQLRAGKFNVANNLEFNKKDPGYIQIKYGNSELKKTFKKVTETKKIISPPTHLIRPLISSFLPDGTALQNDLSPEQYSQADRHLVSLTVESIEDGNILFTFDNGGNPYTSRSEAFQDLKEQLEQQKGSYEKWKIITPTFEVLDYLGEDIQRSKVNQTVLYPNYYTEKQFTKEVEVIEKTTTSDEGSVINVVASKINLLSHDGEHDFDLTDPESLITGETQKKINTDAHPLVYGDTLVEFLELIRNYVKDHTHPYHQDVAVDSNDKTDVLDFDLQTILNKNINSN
jgi:hypothetical protein